MSAIAAANSARQGEFPLGKALVALLLLSFAHTLPIAALPMHLRHSGATNAHIGMVVGAYAAGGVAFRVFCHGWLRRWGYPRSLAAATFACGVFALALPWAAPNTWAMALVRIGHGFALAAFMTAIYAYAYADSPAPRRGLHLGLLGATTGVTVAAAPALGLWLLQQYGFAALFATCAALALAGAWLPLGMRAQPAAAMESRVAPSATAVPGLLLIALLAATLGLLEAFLPLIARQRQLDNPYALFVCFGICLVLGRIAGGHVSERVHAGAALAASAALCAVAFALMLPPGIGLLVAAAICYGLGFGAGSAIANVKAIARGNDPAGNASHAALAFDGGVALGAWSAGVAATQLDHVIWLGLGFALAALALLKRTLRQ